MIRPTLQLESNLAVPVKSAASALLLIGSLLITACWPGDASAQSRRPSHIGAQQFDIQPVPLNAPPERGNGTMTLSDVWEETTVEEDVCNAEEESAAQAEMQACRQRFWNRYDPAGYARGHDLEGYVEACRADGGTQEECTTLHQEQLDERMNGFMEDCFGSDGCREAFERCDRIGDQCTRRFVEWNYYEARTFSLPCRPFDYLDWEDKRMRDDWEGGRWGRIEKIENRGFVGDPNPVKGFLGLEGKPMIVRVRSGETGPDGRPLQIGSYFFADYRYGRIAVVSYEEPASLVEITLPFEYKDAGLWRHGWVNDLWVCQETFTRTEIEQMYRDWGILPPGEEEQRGEEGSR